MTAPQEYPSPGTRPRVLRGICHGRRGTGYAGQESQQNPGSLSCRPFDKMKLFDGQPAVFSPSRRGTRRQNACVTGYTVCLAFQRLVLHLFSLLTTQADSTGRASSCCNPDLLSRVQFPTDSQPRCSVHAGRTSFPTWVTWSCACPDSRRLPRPAESPNVTLGFRRFITPALPPCVRAANPSPPIAAANPRPHSHSRHRAPKPRRHHSHEGPLLYSAHSGPQRMGPALRREVQPDGAAPAHPRGALRCPHVHLRPPRHLAMALDEVRSQAIPHPPGQEGELGRTRRLPVPEHPNQHPGAVVHVRR